VLAKRVPSLSLEEQVQLAFELGTSKLTRSQWDTNPTGIPLEFPNVQNWDLTRMALFWWDKAIPVGMGSQFYFLWGSLYLLFINLNLCN
jgi:hypothetical protein